MLAIFLIVCGVIFRLLPHAAYFTPIAAIALFGGVYIQRRYALLLPLAALIISDSAIGFGSLRTRLSVYGSFLIIGLIGMAIRNKKSVLTVIGGTLGGSVIFYLITNFAFFYPTTMYAHNVSGIMSSYFNALPFLRNTLLGDIF